MDKFHEDDQLLIDLLFKKDKAAFSFLYDTYSPALHGSIIEIVANKELAAKILLEAFMTAWNIIDSYDKTKQGLFTWMLHIARSIALRTMRSIGAWPDAAQLEEISGGMRNVLRRMDNGSKQVIELMYYKGYTV